MGIRDVKFFSCPSFCASCLYFPGAPLGKVSAIVFAVTRVVVLELSSVGYEVGEGKGFLVVWGPLNVTVTTFPCFKTRSKNCHALYVSELNSESPSVTVFSCFQWEICDIQPSQKAETSGHTT